MPAPHSSGDLCACAAFLSCFVYLRHTPQVFCVPAQHSSGVLLVCVAFLRCLAFLRSIPQVFCVHTQHSSGVLRAYAAFLSSVDCVPATDVADAADVITVTDCLDS